MLSSVLFEFVMLNIDFLEAKSQNSHGKKLLIVRSLLIIQRLLSCGQNDSRAMLSLSLRGFADLVLGRGWGPPSLLLPTDLRIWEAAAVSGPCLIRWQTQGNGV
jgi:hypothetical protein